MNEPLAIMMRPNKLSDVIGQKHLLGENKVLYNLIKNKKLFSMILYGKPGIGKTTIALMIVNELGLRYRMLNAVINNKKDFDIVIEEAKLNNRMILIMDEIHRLNKDKQDLLLPVLESGLITLIGLTTSNPYHSINPAIRSRCQIYELKPLEYLYTSSVERVKIPLNMCGIVLPRSSFARIGLILPISSYANPGYEGYLPIVIFNASNSIIKIPPYIRIMQLLLCELKGEAIPYEKQKDSKYHNEQKLQNPSFNDNEIKAILGQIKN